MGCADAPRSVPSPVPPVPYLARVAVREPLDHRWSDEIVHFELDLDASQLARVRRDAVHLTDGAGLPLPAELEVASVSGGRAHLKLFTVVSLEPGREVVLSLHEGGVRAPPPGSVVVRREPGAFVLVNDRVEIALPVWSADRGHGAPDVGAIPAPIRAIRRAGGAWMGEGTWTNGGASLAVASADTTILAEGPVRAAVRQRLRFTDGHTYEAVIALGARQDTATVTEDADADAPKIAHRLALPGSVVWHNQFGAAEGAPPWALVESAVDRERPLLSLRPWSFWWLSATNAWASFGPRDGDTQIGVIAKKPSRWLPSGWDGFDRTAIPVAARRGRAEVSFPLAAAPGRPLHREWAIAAVARAHGEPPQRASELRARLVKHSELPLDEVLRMGLDEALVAERAHPSLLFDASAVERARRQARTSPALRARVAAAVAQIDRAGDLDAVLQKGGPAALYRAYAQQGLQEALLEAFLGSDDPRYGRWLAATVEGLARRVVELFLEAPERPSLGASGPWLTEEITRLVIVWDLVGHLLPPDRAAFVRRAMIFGGHILAHPDYWNVRHGLASANPNMTTAIVIPRGLLGAALRGHPQADRWLREAEVELGLEIDGWISPGGAWIESPGYQAAALDAMFLLAAALKRRKGVDLFAHEKLKATLEYAGFLLTAPDPRFARPPLLDKGAPAPMVLPSLGHTFSGWVTPFNGWMAAATAATDPAFSARQQFFWKRQGSMYGNGGRAKGLISALTDTDLPERPPEDTSRAFPGFGAVLRSSWTDPRQSYVALRTGPNEHHYEAGDHGNIVYYAKGAPLCLDWGNVYEPVRRWEPWYHNTVSFEDGGKSAGMTGEIVSVESLPGFAESAHGISRGGGNQRSDRHILMVESPDPLGANYLVMRDHTSDGQPGQRFFYNLFCLADKAELRPGFAHFPGKMGVDLDVFFLSPDKAPLTADHWGWKRPIYTWGDFAEEQHGIRAAKQGSREDFFTVLYPRAPAERAPRVRAAADGKVAVVTHGEGTDVVLLSAESMPPVREGGAVLSGEIAMARRDTKGTLRLAVMGRGAAEMGGFALASDGPTAIEVVRGAVSGLSNGKAHEARLTLPRGADRASVRIDGGDVAAARDGRTLILALPAGRHRFTVEAR